VFKEHNQVDDSVGCNHYKYPPLPPQ